MAARSIAMPTSETGSSTLASGAEVGVAGHTGDTLLSEDGLAPNQAAKLYSDKLSFYEKKEIERFPAVYYAGQNCRSKVKAPTSGFNDGYDNENGEYILNNGDHIAYRYEILCHLGTGAFGQVVKARDHAAERDVAVKLIRNKRKVAYQAKTEVRILEHIKEKDPYGKYSIVQMLDTFSFRRHICIVYELLGTNLYDHMEKTDFFPMPLSSVRKVAARMLVALTFLWKENIIHCDLKPENVLYRSEVPDDVVKVADLGSACYDTKSSYTYIQSRFYRAPEVIFGLPYGRPIDLWSFGCILCELATGYPLFPGENEQDQLLCIIEFLGKPPGSMVTASKKRVCFDENLEPISTPNSKGRVRKPTTKTLASFLGLTPDDVFISFINQFLCWDPDDRIPPRQAMKHPWIEEEFVFAAPLTRDRNESSQRTEATSLADSFAQPSSPSVVPAEVSPGSRNILSTDDPAAVGAIENGISQEGLNVSRSPKRSRPATLTFDSADANDVSNREMNAGGDCGATGRSIIPLGHLAVTLPAPPSVREARRSASIGKVNGTHGAPELPRPLPLNFATGGPSRQPMSYTARRTSLPVNTQLSATAIQARVAAESGAHVNGAGPSAGNFFRRASTNGDNSSNNGTQERDHPSGAFVGASRRTGERVGGGGSTGAAPSTPCLSGARRGAATTDRGPYVSLAAPITERARTTAIEEDNDAMASVHTARCRAKQALPPLQSVVLPLSSPPMSTPAANHQPQRAVSESAAKGHYNAFSPSSTSRRADHAAQRHAQRRRETVMTTIPENTPGTAQPRLPPL